MNNQPEMLRIEVDDRESAGAVLPVLRECGDSQVAVMRLPLGDYVVDGRFLFERKTLTDLVAAIKDGRLFRQALRLHIRRPSVVRS
jgi:DNA excision repair protein ERCC-4